MNHFMKVGTLAVLGAALASCDRPGSGERNQPIPPTIQYRRSGRIQAPDIDEISGLQASRRHPGVLWAHDDGDTQALLAFDESGSELGRVKVEGASNRDWEDITLVPSADGDLLVVADTGDNKRRYESVGLLILREPAPDAAGRYSGSVPVRHAVRLYYPDRKQDTEAVAYDPIRKRLLFLSKRSEPPRLYALDLETALARDEATLEFLGEVDSFRTPTSMDNGALGKRTPYVSRPTGMDISADGSRAAVITYRSLYLFELAGESDWLQGLRGEHMEIVGPEALQEEAVTFTSGGLDLYVTSEGRRAPVYHFLWPRADSGQP